MYGAFVWARRALNRPFRRFPARAVSAGGLLERYGVTADHTGSHPASGSPLPWYHEWSPEQRQKFAGLIDEMYELFVTRVRHSRCNERTASCSTSLLALGVSPPVLPARFSAAGLTPGVRCPQAAAARNMERDALHAVAKGRLRRGHFVIIPPHIPFVWIIPIGTADVSDE